MLPMHRPKRLLIGRHQYFIDRVLGITKVPSNRTTDIDDLQRNSGTAMLIKRRHRPKSPWNSITKTTVRLWSHVRSLRKNTGSRSLHGRQKRQIFKIDSHEVPKKEFWYRGRCAINEKSLSTDVSHPAGAKSETAISSFFFSFAFPHRRIQLSNSKTGVVNEYTSEQSGCCKRIPNFLRFNQPCTTSRTQLSTRCHLSARPFSKRARTMILRTLTISDIQ